MFAVCVTAGYLLAALGEGRPFSTGTLIGAFMGAIAGLLIGFANRS